jgi:hypothetical protein
MTVGPIIASFARREMRPPLPKATRASAGRPRRLPFRALWAARITRFWRRLAKTSL